MQPEHMGNKILEAQNQFFSIENLKFEFFFEKSQRLLIRKFSRLPIFRHTTRKTYHSKEWKNPFSGHHRGPLRGLPYGGHNRIFGTRLKSGFTNRAILFVSPSIRGSAYASASLSLSLSLYLSLRPQIPNPSQFQYILSEMVQVGMEKQSINSRTPYSRTRTDGKDEQITNNCLWFNK